MLSVVPQLFLLLQQERFSSDDTGSKVLLVLRCLLFGLREVARGHGVSILDDLQLINQCLLAFLALMEHEYKSVDDIFTSAT